MTDTRWPSVPGFRDGITELSAANLNAALTALAARTDALRSVTGELDASGMLSSVRVRNAPARGVSDGMPVYHDAVSGFFRPALAAVGPDGAPLPSADAAGIAVASTGTSCTVVAAGVVPVSAAAALAALPDGPHYLSGTDAGGFSPSPPAVISLLGHRVGGASGYFIVAVPGAASHGHSHTPVALDTGAAGEEDGELSAGFAADGGPGGPRLRITGTWIGGDDTVYTLWVSSVADAPAEASAEPASFAAAWLNWSSSDAAEGAGSVRLRGIGQEVPFGAKGALASFECFDDPDAADYAPWSASFPADHTLRTWTVSLPGEAAGWLPNAVRGTASSAPAAPAVTFYGYGGGHSGSVRVGCGPFVTGEAPAPVAGLLFTFEGDLFEFVAPGAPASVSNAAAVPLGADDAASYAALFQAAGDRLGTAGGVYHDGDIAVGYSDAAPTVPWPGAADAYGPGAFGDPGTGVTVTDGVTGESLCGAAALTAVGAYVPLPCGDSMWFAFSEAAAVGDGSVSAVPSGVWAIDTKPSAGALLYAAGMHPAARAVLPAEGMRGAALLGDGVELADAALGQDDPSFSVVFGVLRWLPSAAPWTLYGRLTLHVPRALGTLGHVTSLAGDGPVTVRACGGAAASAGALVAGFNPGFADDPAPGSEAVTGYSPAGVFLKAPFIRSVTATAPLSVSVTGGVASLSYDGDGAVSADFCDFALENAKQEMVGMYPYIRLPGLRGSYSVASGFVAKFRVPYSLPADRLYRVAVAAALFGEDDAASALAAPLSFAYSVLPDVTALGGYGHDANLRTGALSPEARAVSVAFAAGYAGFDPMLVHNDPSLGADVANARQRAFGTLVPDPAESPSVNGVRAGSIVAVRVSRAAPAAGSGVYTGSLGIVSMRWTLKQQ